MSRPVLATILAIITAAFGLSAESSPANWALDRIDQRALPLDEHPIARVGGAGITIYIIDTGVRVTHPEFGGRAHAVGDFMTGSPGAPDADDCAGPDGHGTLNASLAAGATFGVAPQATIRVLRAAAGAGCQGDANAVIRAVDWITSHGQRPAVVNISFRFANPALNEAIQRSVAAGFLFTLSAGTAGEVTKYWGSDLPRDTVIVAGTDAHDTAMRDDYGPALTMFAPSVSVMGAGLRGDRRGFTPTRQQSGDSFAAPLAAGVAARYLEHHPQAAPRAVRQALIDAATTGVVTNPGGSPNRLLHLTN
jgi:subtilisin family serine protease